MTVFAPGWRPATDVVETPSTIEVRLELPGVDLQDIDLSLTGTVLVVKGRRRLPEISPSAIYHLVEIQHGVFRTEVGLPTRVDARPKVLRCELGVLAVSFEKTESAHDER